MQLNRYNSAARLIRRYFPIKPVKLVLFRNYTAQGVRVKLACPKHTTYPHCQKQCEQQEQYSYILLFYKMFS